VREAKKLYQKEFIRWFKLTSEINPLLRFFRMVDIKIPTLYVMGEQDYLFLPTIRKITKTHQASDLFIVPDCGHVVNVEQPLVFNREVIRYLDGLPS
ncbi:MAG: alpha/beta hydrolase, partial [Bacteroidota bacterium]